jgi:hypothetical protein
MYYTMLLLMGFDVHNAIASRLKELRQLCEQRDFVERQLVQVNIALRSLAEETDNNEERAEVLKEIEAARRKPAGLTQAILNSLAATPHDGLSANEVRYWLEREGFDLSDYSQPLAAISVTLRRLADGGRARATHHGRNVTYQWIAD